MRRFKSKKGFTLVECVVAMAVLAIMSLLLMMILNVTIKARNNNMTMEREIDQQIDQLVKATVTAEAQTQQIEFVQDIGGGVTSGIEAIPGDGSQGMKAKKVYNEGYDAELDVLEYDYEDYQKFKDIANGQVPGSPLPAGANLVYGSAAVNSDASGRVSITEMSCTDNGNGTKTVNMKVSTNVSDASVEAALKIVLPTAAYSIKDVSQINASLVAISDNVVRIEPSSAGYVESQFSFIINSDSYTNDYECATKFYTGSGTGNSAQFEKDGTGKFNPVP